MNICRESVDMVMNCRYNVDMNTSTTPALTHKEMTAHVRSRLKQAGISAGVRMQSYCGERVIYVYPRGGPYARFTEAEQDTIALIGQVNGLSFVEGKPVTATYKGHYCFGHGFRFYLGYTR